MREKKTLTFFLFAIVFLFSGCAPQQISQNLSSFSPDRNKIYFATRQFGTEGFANLYSFNPSDNTFHLELSRPAPSNDPLVFTLFNDQSEMTDLYFVERFSSSTGSGLPSIVSHFATDGSNATQSQFPENLYDMIADHGTLNAIGYDLGNFFKSSFDTTLALANTQINGFTSLEGSARTSSVLIANGRVFIVSQGSYLEPNQPPTIYMITENLQNIAKKWTIDSCFNAFQQMHVGGNNAQLVLSCNPQYTPTDNQQLTVILVDVSTAGEPAGQNPIQKVLLSQESRVENGVVSGVQEIVLGGVSQDNTSVFVTERHSTSPFDFGEGPIVASYWLNLTTNTTVPVNKVADFVTYHKPTNTYLFSCAVNSGNHTCQKGDMAVGHRQDGADSAVIKAQIQGNLTNGFAQKRMENL